MRLFFGLIIGLFLLASCNNNKQEATSTNDNSSTHHVIVEEVVQTSSYTYLSVNENDQTYWMAVTKINANIGDEFTYSQALEMKDFKSKELDRVFDRILFIQNISKVGENPHTAHANMVAEKNKSKVKLTELDETIEVEAVEGGITIEETFKNGEQYANKKVIVSGKVVKVNKNIMNRNWVHLQDGTKHGEDYDLTVTTQEMVNVGDVVTFEGTVSIKKEFGSGYSYDLIIEDAVVK